LQADGKGQQNGPQRAAENLKESFDQLTCEMKRNRIGDVTAAAPGLLQNAIQ
jgi:hypothetical protein